MKKTNSGNYLETETSPYLLQHAHNPVNWHPWGEEAFELARKQDKPILLSIGYASCHWCHVMMHESFEDPEIAATMNRMFINIKVDKQERPDIDKIYQIVYQLLMGQGGGWPLTMFLSPTTLMPYYGATYIPKEVTEDQIGFNAMLHRLNDIYYHEKEKIKQQELHTMAVLQILNQLQPANNTPLSQELIQQAETALINEFDPAHGGFGNDAKFPNCPSLEFILHSTEPMTRHVALSTLNTMANGGIYDQLGGGFFRYTVDPLWHIPHFEKMLYDNAQLVGIYAEAFKLTNNMLYKNISLETGKWLATELLDPTSNGFFSAIDADSEGQEGLYYLWDVAEIKQLLTHEEFQIIKKYFNLNQDSNFEAKWHLYVNSDIAAPEQQILFAIKHKLLQQRQKRIAPSIDTMIATSCNGLAIEGLSTAGLILEQQEFLDLANNNIKFIKEHLYVANQLYATWQDRSPKITAFLDDYAFVLHGILTFINGDPKHEYIKFCCSLADDLINNFYDSEYGGFYFISNQANKLFFRPKTFTDDSSPSGNGIACLALLKLGLLINNREYIEKAKKTINAVQAYLNDAPEVHLSMCRAYELLHKENL